MKILAIESSCDETSIAIIENGKILSNIISSQIDVHKLYGGVVPEIASRLHFDNFPFVLMEALSKAKIDIKDIDKIAYTAEPGLIGCLHIGKVIAKTLSSYLKKDLIPCNHIEGHIYANAIENNFSFPLLALIVSGGHTQLFIIKKHLDFKLIGTTVDDAVGEAYDKVARMLGLQYPGGPLVDKLSKKGKDTYKLPFPKHDDSLDFSFSGLKSAAANIIGNSKVPINKANFAASFQNQVVKILLDKVAKASKLYSVKMIVIGGGVSANSLLREKINDSCLRNKITVAKPRLEYCTDNAAMIAKLAEEKMKLRDKNE